MMGAGVGDHGRGGPRGRITAVPWLAFFVGLIALALPFRLHAQPDSPVVTMVVSDPDPVVGRPFQIQVEARTNDSFRGELVAPDFGGLRVVGQTGQMQSQSIRHTFGEPPRIESRTMVGFIVAADRPGLYRVGPASLRMGRQTFSSEVVVLKIGGDAVPEAPDAGLAAQTPGAESMTYDPQLFLRAVIDRREAHVGQQITYTLYMYRRVDGQAQVTRQPSLNGFWTQELPEQPNDQGDVQVVNGQQFRVLAVLRRALFPTRAGDLEIGSPEIVLQPRASIFSFGPPDEPIRRATPPIRVHVLPLPNGLPDTAFVGDASFSAELDRSTLRTGEASSVVVRLRGRGSMRLVELASPVVDGLRFDPPSIEDHPDANQDLVGGERVFTFPFVATRAGTFTIPPFQLPSYDPATDRRRDLATLPLRVTATGAPLPSDEPTATPDGAESPETEGDSVRFGPVSRSSAMRRRSAPVHTTEGFRAALLTPLALLALAFLGLGVRRVMGAVGTRRDPRDARRKDALRDARKAMKAGDSPAFHAAVTSALVAALDLALGEPTSGLTRTELRNLLTARGADEDLVRRILDELEGADFARFSASAGSAEEMERTLARASALLTRIPSLRVGGSEP